MQAEAQRQAPQLLSSLVAKTAKRVATTISENSNYSEKHEKVIRLKCI
jgi:hypothetical protein